VALSIRRSTRQAVAYSPGRSDARIFLSQLTFLARAVFVVSLLLALVTSVRAEGDEHLVKQAREKQALADEAKQRALAAKKEFEEVRTAFQASQAITQAAQKRSAKAANARKNAEEARKHLDSY
jgi:hypothetical protein